MNGCILHLYRASGSSLGGSETRGASLPKRYSQYHPGASGSIIIQ